MPLAIKGTFTAVAVYLLVLIGLAVWTEFEARSVAASFMEEVANLIGSEIAAGMSDPALTQLLQGDAASRQRLVHVISDLSKRSDVVASVTVVDERGQAVVSDDFEIGHQLAIPEAIFRGSTRSQFLSSHVPFQGGRYHLFVPLVRQDSIVGYLRLSLRSRRIGEIYRRAQRQLIVVALVGLTGIGFFGVLLRVQLSRRSAALARTVEATMRGESVPTDAPDEFAAALEAAGKLGRELHATRERSTQAERRVNALANFMDVGVLLLGPQHELEFANATARTLLGNDDPGALERRWSELKPIFDAALARAASNGSGAAVDVEVPGGEHPRHLRLELHRHGDEGNQDHLVLVKDRDLLEAFETDLRLATQMRGLARVYGALAHEIKAPLGAMSLNLELLNDALAQSATDEGDAGLRARQQRYAHVLREELARLNRSLVVALNQTTTLSAARERFDLRDLIRDLEALLAPQAKQQRVGLAVAMPETSVPLVAHRDRLKQALLNIAANALEAMADGGQMAMAVEAANGFATISVRDSGPGIPPEVLDKIYRMYFTTKDGGTGIGLHVARAVVESHGGAIHVESQLGHGTCVRVTLPMGLEET
ncbi:MAG TPA: ATP-binding protein [Candidatus Kryptonia bacterium]|nr:ATP-binding protein [Candidatus Kryptonia bacterium]